MPAPAARPTIRCCCRSTRSPARTRCRSSSCRARRTPDLAYNDPRAVGRVAAHFKDLPLIVSHGFYPYVDEAIATAFRHENVFLSPDMYMFAPGGRLYIEAANGFMADQYLFGTSYPFRAMRQSVDDLRAIGLTPDVLEKVSWRTAARLFGLPAPAGI